MNSSENQVRRLTVDDIEIPEGMLKAFVAGTGYDCTPPWHVRGLTAALLWLAENPIVPSDEQICEAAKSFGVSYKVNYSVTRQFFSNWQRRMFLRKPAALPDEVKRLVTLGDRGEISVEQAVRTAWKLGGGGK